MSRIVASTGHLLHGGQNASFGNHLLHLMFCAKLAVSRNIPMVIPVDSNLDNLLNLNNYKVPFVNPELLFSEEFGGNPKKCKEKGYRNLEYSKKLLSEEIKLPEGDFFVEGWFQHKSTMLTLAEFKHMLPVREELIEEYYKKYPFIRDSRTIAIHYRGTDFLGFGNTDRRLPENYYRKALKRILKEMGKKVDQVDIHIFSDEPSVLQKYLRLNKRKIEKNRLNVIIHEDDYYLDWLGLFLANNAICSNSSFAYSACFYNKNIVIQPQGLLHLNSKIPDPVDAYYTNSIVLNFRVPVKNLFYFIRDFYNRVKRKIFKIIGLE